MSDTLFTSQTPAAQGSDGAPGITTATTFKLANPRTCEGIQFYATATPAGTYTVALWRVAASDAGAGGAGTLIASKAVSSASITGNAYNIITFSAGDVVGGESLSLDTTHLYRAGVHNGSLYVATNSFFTSALTNGDITGVQDNTDPLSNGWTIRQGTFIIDAALQYPRQVGTSASYFVGPALTPTGGSAIAPAGVAVSVAVGQPSLAQTLPVAPSGIAVSATVGQPSLANSGRAAAPNGIAVSVALGQPSLSQPFTVAPNGIAVPVTLGQPVVAMVVPGTAARPNGIAVPVTVGQPSLQMHDQGSWAGLLDALVQARADHEVAERRRRAPRECPVHGWPLEVVRGVRHCKFGGHVVRTW